MTNLKVQQRICSHHRPLPIQIMLILLDMLDMLNNKSNISNNQTPITPRKYLQGKSLVNSLASNTYISYCLTLRQT